MLISPPPPPPPPPSLFLPHAAAPNRARAMTQATSRVLRSAFMGLPLAGNLRHSPNTYATSAFLVGPSGNLVIAPFATSDSSATRESEMAPRSRNSGLGGSG